MLEMNSTIGSLVYQVYLLLYHWHGEDMYVDVLPLIDFIILYHLIISLLARSDI